MNQNTVAGGSRGNAGNSGDFDGQHTYVIQDNRRESQDEELEGAGVEMQEGDMENSESGELREQDRFLPIANVARIMKKGIPSQGKIAKDARECVQECVSEFISFITSEASDRCQAEKVSFKLINFIICIAAYTIIYIFLSNALSIFISKCVTSFSEKNYKWRGYTFRDVYTGF